MHFSMVSKIKKYQRQPKWTNALYILYAMYFFRTRRLRKAFGGGIRQGGVLAAAALYALDNVSPNLYVDHEYAKALSKGRYFPS